MTREEQISAICRLVESRAELSVGSVSSSTSINKKLGFDGQDLFDIVEESARCIGATEAPPFDFNVFNSERSAIAVALYHPFAMLLSKLMPEKFARPISPTEEVESLTPEKLRDILSSNK